jgi:hypothetical protein
VACTLMRAGRSVVITTKPALVRANCGHVDIIVAAFAAHDLCSSGVVIDRQALDTFGAYAVWLTPSGIRVRTVLEADGMRAWTQGTAHAPAPP